MRILLVEDDDSIREVFKLVLETDPCVPDLSVVAFSSGLQAREWLEANQADLVLLDITLSGEDGFGVFELLRATRNGGAIPIVAVTAHNHPALEERARRVGFAGFVTKPIDFERQLVPLLRRHVRGLQVA